MGSFKPTQQLKGKYAKEVWKGRQLVRVLIALFFRTLQLITRAFLNLFVYRNPGEKVTSIENVILLDSATSLAYKIRHRKLTSFEVVQSYIDRIKEINPLVNCVVDERFKEALEEAKEADKLLQNTKKTVAQLENELPFLGVPFTVKEAIAVKNLHSSAALYAKRHETAEEDADCVAHLRKAGAIPLAVTNVPELCMWWETFSGIYGLCKNPYNTNHTVGGSSGGEACLQAAGGSPMGLGSDMGGSVRLPSFFNGVFGHKSSSDVVSMKGHLPLPEQDEQRAMVSIGPITRFASDLLPILKALAPDRKDLKLEEKVDVKELKFYFAEDDGGNPLISPIEPEIRVAIKHIVHFLKRVHGIQSRQVDIKALYYSMAIWLGKMKASGESQLLKELGNGKKLNPILEIIKFPFGMSNHTFPLLCIATMEELNASYGSEHHLRLLQKCKALKQEFEELLGNDGVFIYPTHPTAAPLHGEPLFRPFNVAYTAIFNALGFPSTHVPMGLNAQGLPIGVQIVANHNMDRLSIAVAVELEKAFGGWVQP